MPSKLNISLYTLTPPGSRLSSRSSQFTLKTPKTVIQLQKQATLLKNLLKQRSNIPPSPSKTAVDQIVKGTYLSMHTATILAQENASPRRVNKKKRQKRTRSHRHIAHKRCLTIAEDLQLEHQWKRTRWYRMRQRRIGYSGRFTTPESSAKVWWALGDRP